MRHRLPSGSSIESIHGTNGGFAGRYESRITVLGGLNWGASIIAALRRWFQFICGLLRALRRVSRLSFVLPIALAQAAVGRLTTNPAASALARGRAAWFHRWSIRVCSVLGFRIKRKGFVPVSGLVIVNHLTLIDTLLLASLTPFVFVVDLDLRRRPIIGGLARLAGALFRDRGRIHDVARINFLIARALKRRQMVVVFRSCAWRPGPVSSGFPSALLQTAAEIPCTLTAAAISFRSVVTENAGYPPAKYTVAEILMQPRSQATVAFCSPTFHQGDRKQLAAQVWRELCELEQGA